MKCDALVSINFASDGDDHASHARGMVSKGMQRQFTRFVESPSRDNYLAVRKAVMRTTPLPIEATQLAELVRLLDADEFQEVLDRIELLPATKVLSPRVHFLAAEAADGLGDGDSCELERFLFVLCVQGLLATGDGSAAAPYCVCNASDELDVLEVCGHELAATALVEHEGKLCDVVTCADGRRVWFDVTAIFADPPRKKRRRNNRLGKRRLVTAAVGRPSRRERQLTGKPRPAVDRPAPPIA
jgi:hypothetical protein